MPDTVTDSQDSPVDSGCRSSDGGRPAGVLSAVFVLVLLASGGGWYVVSSVGRDAAPRTVVAAVEGVAPQPEPMPPLRVEPIAHTPAVTAPIPAVKPDREPEPPQTGSPPESEPQPEPVPEPPSPPLTHDREPEPEPKGEAEAAPLFPAEPVEPVEPEPVAPAVAAVEPDTAPPLPETAHPETAPPEAAPPDAEAHPAEPNPEPGLPEPPPAKPPVPPPLPPLAAEVERVLAGLGDVRCAALSVEAADGALAVSGTVTSDADHALIVSLVEKGRREVPRRVDVAVAARTLCDPLLAIEGARAANAGRAVPLAVTAPTPNARFPEGDELLLDVRVPDMDGHLSVTYFTIDGTVVHLLPNPLRPEVPVAAGETLRVGGRREGQRFWTVGPPFGRELVVAIVNPAPLFGTERPEVEPAPRFLADLRTALADHPDAVASALFITTVPR
ncbi:DUF4384 domain-containing protein [Azospirillum halopraeferens]|uniref:DUF4384 domain-containing protein n=1 Tax=Azospirillum halopraeferens TaxID=34010 RepID=UPI0003FF9166|nr:DUF4384 domain-containing protein [Azospirillum halopraeferens]